MTLSIELMGDIRATVQAPARGPWPGRKQVAPDRARKATA